MKLILSKPINGQTEAYVHFRPTTFGNIEDNLQHADRWQKELGEIEFLFDKRYGFLEEQMPDKMSMRGFHLEDQPAYICRVHFGSCTRLDTAYCATMPDHEGFSVCSPSEPTFWKPKGRKRAFERAISDFSREERAILWKDYIERDHKVLEKAA